MYGTEYIFDTLLTDLDGPAEPRWEIEIAGPARNKGRLYRATSPVGRSIFADSFEELMLKTLISGLAIEDPDSVKNLDPDEIYWQR